MMEFDNPIDVSKFDIEILSYDKNSREKVFRRINKIVRKHSSIKYLVIGELNQLECSGDHKVAVVNDNMEILYKEVCTIHGKFIGINSNCEFKEFEIVKTEEELDILDLEVEDTNCYFSNGILSHNTMYGNPETVQGGRGLKFYASTRLEVRKDEDIKENGNPIGHTIKCKTVKNRAASPQQVTTIRLDWGKGFNVNYDLIDLAVKDGIVTRGGAGWLTVFDKKIQGDANFVKLLETDADFKSELLEKMGLG